MSGDRELQRVDARQLRESDCAHDALAEVLRCQVSTDRVRTLDPKPSEDIIPKLEITIHPVEMHRRHNAVRIDALMENGRAVFDVIDANRDGGITKREVNSFLQDPQLSGKFDAQRVDVIRDLYQQWSSGESDGLANIVEHNRFLPDKITELSMAKSLPTYVGLDEDAVREFRRTFQVEVGTGQRVTADSDPDSCMQAPYCGAPYKLE